jgi:hypothetical protein
MRTTSSGRRAAGARARDASARSTLIDLDALAREHPIIYIGDLHRRMPFLGSRSKVFRMAKSGALPGVVSLPRQWGYVVTPCSCATSGRAPPPEG